MGRLAKPRYTLVQHSGWTAKLDKRFRHQVEQTSIDTEAELGKVINLGGLVFDTYMEAEEALDDLNNPTGPDGNPRRVELTFNNSCKLRGRALYIPPTSGSAE